MPFSALGFLSQYSRSNAPREHAAAVHTRRQAVERFYGLAARGLAGGLGQDDGWSLDVTGGGASDFVTLPDAGADAGGDYVSLPPEGEGGYTDYQWTSEAGFDTGQDYVSVPEGMTQEEYYASGDFTEPTEVQATGTGGGGAGAKPPSAGSPGGLKSPQGMDWASIAKLGVAVVGGGLALTGKLTPQQLQQLQQAAGGAGGGAAQPGGGRRPAAKPTAPTAGGPSIVDKVKAWSRGKTVVAGTAIPNSYILLGGAGVVAFSVLVNVMSPPRRPPPAYGPPAYGPPPYGYPPPPPPPPYGYPPARLAGLRRRRRRSRRRPRR